MFIGTVSGRDCEHDIDECSHSSELCNNGICVNSLGMYYSDMQRHMLLRCNIVHCRIVVHLKNFWMLRAGKCVCHRSIPPDISVCYVIFMNLWSQIAVKGYIILYLADYRMTLLLSQ